LRVQLLCPAERPGQAAHHRRQTIRIPAIVHRGDQRGTQPPAGGRDNGQPLGDDFVGLRLTVDDIVAPGVERSQLVPHRQGILVSRTDLQRTFYLLLHAVIATVGCVLLRPVRRIRARRI